MSEYRSYTEQMTVLDGDSDFRRCLKPSALFRYVEQVSADHARAYGMDHAFFRERHSAFLVGKQALRVWRMPGRAEKINLTTACEVFKKGTMKRLTTITSETGEKLALVDCRWMIVDTEAGRILRTPGWNTPPHKTATGWNWILKFGSRALFGQKSTTPSARSCGLCTTRWRKNTSTRMWPICRHFSGRSPTPFGSADGGRAYYPLPAQKHRVVH